MTKDEIKVLEKTVHDLLIMEAGTDKPQKKQMYSCARKIMIEQINKLGYKLHISNDYQCSIKKEVQK